MDERRVWFRWGWIPFYRITADAPVSQWPAHGHVVVAGCPHRARSAVDQEAAARKGRNALVNNGPFRGVLWPIVTWEKALERQAAEEAASTAIPRLTHPKPWPAIVEDGIRGRQTIRRLQQQLSVPLTEKLDHFTIRALKVWLGGVDDGRGILAPIDVRRLQYRIDTVRDAQWGPQTTRALQRYLNKHR